MNKVSTSETDKGKCLSSILSIDISWLNKSELTEKSAGAVFQEINKHIARHEGHIISALNGQFVIVYPLNNFSEKHAYRAYICYAQIEKITAKHNLSIKGFLHSAELHAEDGIFFGEALTYVQDALYSSAFLAQDKILFSESAKELLENNLEFQQVPFNDTKYNIKLYTTLGHKEKPGYRTFFVGRSIETDIIKHSIKMEKYVYVTGPAGIGKTSLAEHYMGLQDFLTIRCSFIEGRHENILRHIFDELTTRVTQERKQKISDWSKYLLSLIACTDDERALLKQLDYDAYTSRSGYRLGAQILVKYITAFEINRRTCLFLDDLQWAPEGFEDFIECINESKQNISMIATSRTLPKVEPSSNTVITLRPLCKEEVEVLIKEIIPYDLITERFIDSVYEHTAGNPFYVDEVLKGTIHSLRVKRDKLQWHGEIHGIGLGNKSFNIRNLIHFQLQAIPKELLTLLETCACFGKRFSVDDISLALGTERAKVEESLRDLSMKDFLSFSLKSGSYEFVHSIKERATYDSIPRKRQKDIHTRIAIALLPKSPQRGKPTPVLSHQLHSAGMWKNSYKYNLRDALIYLNNIEPRLAMDSLNHCLTCATELGCFSKIREMRLHLLLCRTYFMFGAIEKAKKYIEQIHDIFTNKELLRYASVWNEALNELTFYYWIVAKYDKTIEVIDRSENDFAFIITPETAGALKVRRIGVYSDTGRLQKSSQLIDKLLADDIGNSFSNWKSIFPVQTVLHAMKSRNAAYTGQYQLFELSAKKAIKSLSLLPHESLRIFTLCYVANGYIEFSNFKHAAELLREAISIMEKHHIYVLRDYILAMFGYCNVALGDTSGIFKITSAIYNVQKEGRLCRLPLLYLFLVRSKILMSDKVGFKRLLLKGIKQARKQGETWVLNALLDCAQQHSIPIDTKKNTYEDNIIQLTRYKSVT